MACQGVFFVLNSPSCVGAVAQLGERLHGMQEVVSSSLISSIAKILIIRLLIRILLPLTTPKLPLLPLWRPNGVQAYSGTILKLTCNQSKSILYDTDLTFFIFSLKGEFISF